jgi:hypothetical protein
MDPEISKIPQPSASKSVAKENRRSLVAGPHIAHSCLLLCSTALAALFCYLYITKPLVEILPGPTRNASSPRPEPNPDNASPPPSSTKTKAPTHANLEETNLRVQHILTAETAGKRSDRIELTVPVLYRSRYLRWSETEVDTARTLMEKLVRYQEQSRLLRQEGHDLLNAWNELVSRALPSEALRADSPSLPSNQQDANEAPRPSGWTSTELIQIQGPDK